MTIAISAATSAETVNAICSPRPSITTRARFPPTKSVWFVQVYVNLLPPSGNELVSQGVSTADCRLDGLVDLSYGRLACCQVMHSQHQLTGEVLNRAPQLAGGAAYTPEDEAVFGEFW